MTRKAVDQPLDILERRFQALQDQVAGMPVNCREELQAALQEVAGGIAALRADLEVGLSQPAPSSGEPHAAEDLAPADTILRHLFSAIPDLFTVQDPDYHVIMSNWHGQDFVSEAARLGHPKCYQVYLHRDQPCEDCQLRKVVATGQPQKMIKVYPLDKTIREIHAFPIRDELGRVFLVAEHVRDITARHLADKALKESEERFRAHIEDSPESLFLTDVQGTILAASRVAAQRLGKNLTEITGVGLFELMPPEVTFRRRPFFEQAVATACPVRFEDTRDDFHFEINIHPILDADGKVSMLSIMAVDITDRKKAEEALKESETKYRTLVENIPQKVFIKNRDSRYVSINQNYAQDLGIRPEEVLGKVDYDFFPRELADKYQADDQRVMATGRTEIIEERYVQQGKEIWINTLKTPVKDENGDIVGVLGTFFDITERKRAEQALKESEERFRAIFETAQDSIFIKDRSLRYTMVNPAMAQLFSRPAADLIGKTDAELFGEKAVAQIQAGDQRVLNGELVREAHTKPVRGAPVTFHVVKVPLHDEAGQVVGLCGIARDITDLKRTEEALRESEERFKFLFEFAPDAYFLMSLQGDFLDVNRSSEEISGYDRKELIGKNFQALPLLKDRQNLEMAELLKQAKPGKILGPVEYCMARKDGGQVIMEAKGLPLLVKGETLLLVIGRDITVRKRAEEALRLSEKRFRDITQHLAEWVWEVDPQGKFIYSSPTVEQLLGYQPEEVLGKHFYDFFLPEEREALKHGAWSIFATKQPFRDFLNPNLHKNGRIVWLSTSGVPILDEPGNLLGYRGADIDVTERREAEELSHNLIAKSPVGIYLIQDKKFQRVNRLFYATTGFNEAEVVDLDPFDLVHPEDREATRANAVKMLRGLSSAPYEYRSITKGGETKWIMESVTSIQYRGKRATLGYFMDITERKQLENQLFQAQKMEAVGQLAGGVAHDFNNLLMAIMGYGELMRAEVIEGDPLYDHLENILKASDRAAALTQQLLTFSRRQIAPPQMVDLNRVVLDLEPMLRRLIGEDIDLEIVTDPELGAVKAVPGHLSQIIMNLMVNARDAMPRGGRLTLKTALVNLETGGRSRFTLMPPGVYVKLEVRDAGVGMDEATLTHVFEPFFTTKEPGKGTGLGLSTVYGIVKQSGGYLDVASQPGAGSTFTIYLPRLAGAPKSPKAQIPIAASLRGQETILLVEDEDVLRNLLVRYLRLCGYTVLEARHGGEALLLCERHPGTIHLMVTDVVMPQMSGRELADRLNPLRPEMQVLYMSGYTADEVVQRGVADLSLAFLQKPFRPMDLAHQIQAVLHPSEPG